MDNTTVKNIAIVGGIVLFVPAFVVSPGLGITFAVILILGFIAAQRVVGGAEIRIKKDNVGDILTRMWIPVRDELSEVVRTGGRVTSASSVWSSVPNLYKQESPTTFHEGMEWYVNERAQVAALVASVTSTEESRRRQELEQQQLLFISRELLAEAKKTIYFIPGSVEIARRAEAAQPRPSAQQTVSAATRPSAGSTVGTAPAAPASQTTQAQTAIPALTISARPAPPRPAPAPMRIADMPMTSERAVPTPTRREPEPPPVPSAPPPPSRPAPTPPRITYTPMQAPPAVAAPAPREPEPPPPPSVPPAPAPVTASVPEPVVAAPAPSEPEPAAKPSEPPVDLPLDVASVCDALFDPKMMSYEANRLFDDRYKDATVRWKGTARRSNVYSYDFEFGDGGGTKAELDVYEVKQQYGSRMVKAFVQFPTEAAADLGARIGQDVQFEGRLLTCEGSARRIYVADASVVD